MSSVLDRAIEAAVVFGRVFVISLTPDREVLRRDLRDRLVAEPEDDHLGLVESALLVALLRYLDVEPVDAPDLLPILEDHGGPGRRFPLLSPHELACLEAVHA